MNLRRKRTVEILNTKNQIPRPRNVKCLPPTNQLNPLVDKWSTRLPPRKNLKSKEVTLKPHLIAKTMSNKWKSTNKTTRLQSQIEAIQRGSNKNRTKRCPKKSLKLGWDLVKRLIMKQGRQRKQHRRKLQVVHSKSKKAYLLISWTNLLHLKPSRHLNTSKTTKIWNLTINRKSQSNQRQVRKKDSMKSSSPGNRKMKNKCKR